MGNDGNDFNFYIPTSYMAHIHKYAKNDFCYNPFVFAETTMCANVRKPAVAGQFYASDPDKLRREINDYLNNVPSLKLGGDLVALMSPHAGYIYSAQTASFSYKLMSSKNYDTVILLGNSHNYFLNKAAVYLKGAFSSPLGTVKIDESLAAEIIKISPLSESNESAHIIEHSLEVQLPFFQVVLREFKVVPILLSGKFSLKDCEKLGESIAKAVKKSEKKVLIIVSSDMSHFPSDADARIVDISALKYIENFDIDGLSKNISETLSKNYPNLHCVLCAQEAVYTAMFAAKELGADTARVLHYSNSSDASGDKSRVVGYSAVAFVKTEKRGDGTEGGMQKTENCGGGIATSQKEEPEVKISKKNQKFLLELARKSITEHLFGKKANIPTTDDPELKQNAAVFVTLRQNKQLRGCIGNTVAQKPLIEAVAEMVLAAATEDHRFPKMTQSELNTTAIEISVLSPMKRVKSADEIKQNIHGVAVRKGFRGGLFLPQVWEHFSTKEEFLSELCEQKAGLEPEAWKDTSTELHIFTVFKFRE